MNIHRDQAAEDARRTVHSQPSPRTRGLIAPRGQVTVTTISITSGSMCSAHLIEAPP